MKNTEEMNDVVDIEEIELIYKYLEENNRSVDSGLPYGVNYAILTVTSYSRIAGSNFRTDNSPQLTTQLTIRLDGEPHQGKLVGFKRAYLMFIGDNEQLRNPFLGKRDLGSQGDFYTLYITYPISYIKTIERMLKHPNSMSCGIGDAGTPPKQNIYAACALNVDE